MVVGTGLISLDCENNTKHTTTCLQCGETFRVLNSTKVGISGNLHNLPFALCSRELLEG